MMTAGPELDLRHPPEPMLPRPFRVVDSRRETPDTVTLELESESGDVLAFSPGQYTMLYVFGVGEVPLSVSGDPHRPEVLVHTVRAVGAVTRAIVGLRPGDTVGVRGPYGRGWPVEAARDKDLLVVAGGIGLAPLRPVVYDVIARRPRFRSVSLVYGSRSPADLLYTGELHEWRSRFDMEVEVTVDRPDRDWLGDVGVVTGLLGRVAYRPEETAAMLCGPEIMMKVVGQHLADQGVSPGAIHVSLERNMKCGIGLCGHCQFGPHFVCWRGPVFALGDVLPLAQVAEL